MFHQGESSYALPCQSGNGSHAKFFVYTVSKMFVPTWTKRKPCRLANVNDEEVLKSTGWGPAGSREAGSSPGRLMYITASCMRLEWTDGKTHQTALLSLGPIDCPARPPRARSNRKTYKMKWLGLNILENLMRVNRVSTVGETVES